MGLVSAVGFSRTVVGSVWRRGQGESGKLLQLRVWFDFPGLPQGPTLRCHSKVMAHGNRMCAASQVFTGLDCP